MSCALGERLVAEALPGWNLARASIDTRGVTKLIPALPRYLEQAIHVQPVLCVADTDGQCPVTLLHRWMPTQTSDRFLLRLAVSEAESWLLADRSAIAEYFGLAVRLVPQQPDLLGNAKQEVLRLARRSRVREIRQELVSGTDSNRPGSGYNLHLCRFVQQRWRAGRGALNSASLARALRRVADLGQGH